MGLSPEEREMKTMTTAEFERGDWVQPSVGPRRGKIRPGLRCIDTSGSGNYGYSYALIREAEIGQEQPEHLAESVDIWISDGTPNLGKPGSGAAVTRFRGADVRAAQTRI